MRRSDEIEMLAAAKLASEGKNQTEIAALRRAQASLRRLGPQETESLSSSTVPPEHPSSA